ncbi:hypothetical protein Hanom_Chr16g01450981 [Helianthus anomalus]
MVKTWWIRRWYFLYVSVFVMLLNFRKTCHEKFGVLQTIVRPNTQTLTTHKGIAKHAISNHPRRVFIPNAMFSSNQY